MSRRLIRIIPLAALLALSPLSAPSAQAGEDAPPPSLEEVAPAMEEAMQRLMGMLEMFLRNIPTYEMPEILDNGDIIIRRKRPGDAPPKSPLPGDPDPDISKT